MKSANKDVRRNTVIQLAFKAKGHHPTPSRRDAIRVRGTGAHTAVPNDGISLGTNDLTQIAPGMSRDDSSSFLPILFAVTTDHMAWRVDSLPLDPTWRVFGVKIRWHGFVCFSPDLPTR